MNQEQEQGVGMRGKREAEARTEKRIIDLYEEKDVTLAKKYAKFNDSVIEKCLKTEEERKGKLKHSGWRDYHHVVTDVTLPHTEDEGWVMMRRWACGCAPCREQLEAGTFAERFAHNPNCARARMFGSMNDWKKVRLVPVSDEDEAAGEGEDGDSGEDDDDEDEDDRLAMASATAQRTAQI